MEIVSFSRIIEKLFFDLVNPAEKLIIIQSTIHKISKKRIVNNFFFCFCESYFMLLNLMENNGKNHS